MTPDQPRDWSGLAPVATPTGWLAALDPRARLLAAMGFALAVVALRQLPVAAVAFGLALALPRAAGLPWHLLRRALPLALLMVLLLLTLPFTVPAGPGPALALGPLTASLAGLQLGLLMLLKAGAVLLVLLTLVGTLEPAVFGHALGRLGAPARLVDLLLLTLRQVHLIGDEYRRLRQAMRVRGFVPRADRHTLDSLGWLIGMLLVRAFARSRRVLAAMRLRGWRGRVHLLDELCWRARDGLLLALLLTPGLALVLVDRL